MDDNFTPKFKQLRRAYGFDEVAIVPGEVTINPELVEMGLEIGPHRFAIPFLASAMDAVVDPTFAVAMHKAGGLAVLNLEGLWTKYDDPRPMLEELAEIARGYRRVVVIEMNAGQYKLLVEALIHRPVGFIPLLGGAVRVSQIEEGLKKCLQEST